MATEGLSRYKIEQEIGRGSMGRVYRAQDTILGRTVALKQLKPANAATAGEELVERFTREAQSAARLSHPNVVQVFDVFEDDGSHYIAMEWVDGLELTELIESGSLPTQSRLDVIGQTLDAIQAAHEAGVVHRDLKPANIFVTLDGRVKVADFGIAKILDPGASSMTQIGTVLGTPGYMAPEQVAGTPADHRADIFSVGIIAYELLSGVNPFASESTTTSLYRIVNEHPPPLNIAGLLPHVWPTIARALEKDPNARWPRALDMATALRGDGTAGLAATMVPGTAAATPVPTGHKNTTGVWIAVALAVAGVGIALALVFSSGSQPTAGSVATEPAPMPAAETADPEPTPEPEAESEPEPAVDPAYDADPVTPYWAAFFSADENLSVAEGTASSAERASGLRILVLNTWDYGTLGQPGQSIWVVGAGPYNTESAAQGAVYELERAGINGAYTKMVNQ